MKSPPLLHSEIHGDGGSPFVLMHGLLGSSRNWRSVAKEMGKGFQVHSLDLRNHGNSFHDQQTSILEMSNDLLRYADHHNLQKFILGRSLANNPKVAIFSQPTWGVDIGAATTIRQKLLNLSQTGKAVILISQDLEEIFQLSDKIAVLNNGNLSEVLSANEISATNVGLLMGGNSKSNNDQEKSK